MRMVRRIITAIVASLILAGTFATSAQANVTPPGGGGTCSVYASISFSSTTATVHGAGIDNCATPRYWLRMEVGLNTSSGHPSNDVVHECSKNINYVESCAETGLTVSTSNPAGTQVWSCCATYWYYSSIDFRSLVLTKEYCYHMNG